MSEVASLELCKELFELSGWGRRIEPDGEAPLFDWKQHPDEPDEPYFDNWYHPNSKTIWLCPAYDGEYLREKLRDYDYEIVNLNGNTLSLTSDSSDEPDAAILGGTFAEVMCRLAIELFKSGILRKEE